MRIVVERLVSEEDYGVIAAGRVAHPGNPRNDKPIRFRIWFNNTPGFPVPGEIWDVKGKIVETEWGEQVEVRAARRFLPTGELITRFISAHVPQIGDDRARRLWEAFGTGLASVLADDARIPDIAAVIAPDRPNLSMRVAAAAVRVWREQSAQAQLIDWLNIQGITDLWLARRVSKILGEKALMILQTNPYVLVALLPWNRVDELGLRLMAEQGIPSPHDHARRLVGAVDAAVKLAISKGHTSLDDYMLREYLANRLNVPVDHPRVIEAIQAGVRNLAVKLDRSLWRAPGCAALEASVESRLKEIATIPGPIAVPSLQRLKDLVEDLSNDGKSFLHHEQATAVCAVLLNSLACIQGGAGTGKTHTTKTVVNLWKQFGGEVVGCALSGKAALRLSKASGLRARTIARLMNELNLRDALSERIRNTSLQPQRRKKILDRLDKLSEITPKTLVLVDEASMIDLTSFHQLLSKMPEGARLLLVGDEYQLPPVGFGLIFHRLVQDKGITAYLKTVHRQQEATGIPNVAAAIRDQRMPVFAEYGGATEGVSFVEASPKDLPNAILRIAADLGGFHGGNLLIVTPTNDGRAGIDSLNSVLHEQHRQRETLLEMEGYLGERFSEGDPVIHLANDYHRCLFNGSMGYLKTLNHERGTLTVIFPDPLLKPDEPQPEFDFNRDQMIDLGLAYAVTCHKAQGSSAQRIIIPIFESRLLNPAWLYTAVTRSEIQAVFVGSKESMAKALSLPWPTDARKVGFRWPPPVTDQEFAA